MNLGRSIILYVSVAILATGCASIQFERWFDELPEISDEPDTEYVVKKNDTLYAIAWLYNLSYHDLARWNGIEPPKYLIYPEQRLRLTPPPGQAVEVAKQQSKPKSEVPPRKKAKAQPKAKPKPKPKPRQKQKLAAIQSQAKTTKWQWPLAKMSKPTSYRRGVRIRGQAGQPVRAVAAGVVVYSGFDLKHYEGLIIIKHPGDFFSAYGFVGKLKVKEGAKVKIGQTIAHLPEHEGAKLYFDMRYRGTRLNPLKYMPKLS